MGVVADLEDFAEGRDFDEGGGSGLLIFVGDVGAEPDSVRLCDTRGLLDLALVPATV